jgi:hypothetical protein
VVVIDISPRPTLIVTLMVLTPTGSRTLASLGFVGGADYFPILLSKLLSSP